MKIKLNKDSSHYLKGAFATQIWLRYNQNNLGTTIFGIPQNETTDIGIRRLRMQFYGQVTEKVFFYTQMGENNFTYLNKQFTGFFIHDAVTEYSAVKKHLNIGAGLTGWSGLSRYASPAIGSILTLVAPLYQQSTNGMNNQFLRKLSVYAKGKLDYRVALVGAGFIYQPDAMWRKNGL